MSGCIILKQIDEQLANRMHITRTEKQDTLSPILPSPNPFERCIFVPL